MIIVSYLYGIRQCDVSFKFCLFADFARSLALCFYFRLYPIENDRTHLAPIAYPPADTGSITVARAHGGWSWFMDTPVGGDRYA